MAEAVVLGIVQNILGTLGSDALKKIGQLWGVKDELQALKGTISIIEGVLLDAEDKYHKISQVSAWLQRLKDAFLEAEDLLDEISTATLRRELKSNPVSKFFSLSSLSPLYMLRVAPRIRAVRQKIDAIAKDRQFLLEERHVQDETRGFGRELTHSFVREGEIIGRDDNKREIIELLLDPVTKEAVSVIPIVGIGGLGKTALAQFVFNDEKIKKHFELTIWTCVSNVFDVKSIMRQIIGPDSKKEMMPEQLQTDLRRKIDGQKFLLVLDDFWCEDRQKWLSLKTLLIGGAMGSKILITTRLHSVADITRTVPKPYILGGLSEEKSWDLFARMAFREGEVSKDPEFIAIGKEILRKCKGVPLAMRTLGSLLFVKDRKEQWLQIRDEELADITQTEDDVLPILRLSYDHLPSHLKQCFAYCALFPKDHTIFKDDLIQLWMAQGFIQPSEMRRHLEDVGEEYFMELAQRNFFQDLGKDDFGTLKCCKMHDLMHDVAESVAGKQCTSFWENQGKINERTLHVSYGSALELTELLRICPSQVKKLRTLLFIAQPDRPIRSTRMVSNKDISRLKQLRVLHINGAGIIAVPSCISKLMHLRELDLSRCPIVKFPSSIVKLQNLHTLKLRDCFELEELPRDMKKLAKLRHLDIDGCCSLSHMPSGLGELTSLHTLPLFVVSNVSSGQEHHAAGLTELNGLENLRGKLEINNLGCTKEACKGVNLRNKGGLRSLWLKWEHSPEEALSREPHHEAMLEALQPHPNLQTLQIEDYRGTRLPRWMVDDMLRCIPNLTTISFSFCRNIQHLPPLGQLRHLKHMYLRFLDKLEFIENTSSDRVGPDKDRTKSTILQQSFPCLVSLRITECPMLSSLPVLPQLEKLTLSRGNERIMLQLWSTQLCRLKELEIEHMATLEKVPKEWLQGLPSLEQMYVINCPKLTSLSLGMQHLTKLEYLYIDRCEMLDLSVDENGDALQLHGLTNLRTVSIYGMQKLELLPEWLLHLASLQTLLLLNLSNLAALPGWIGDLRSLQNLEIYSCPNLRTLPGEISLLTSLQRLSIIKCRDLEEACKEETGRERPKIAHVQHIKLGW